VRPPFGLSVSGVRGRDWFAAAYFQVLDMARPAFLRLDGGGFHGCRLNTRTANQRTTLGRTA